MAREADAIASVCAHLARDDRQAAAVALRSAYPFTAPTNAGRRYTAEQQTRIFLRDGFTDRYSGERLVFPPVLRVLTAELPTDFPAHPNWRMAETHQAYWDLFPTIDHINPVAVGGADEPANWVTTSMRRNMAKGSSTLDQIGWHLLDPGDLDRWDGMSDWLRGYLDDRPDLMADDYVRKWTRALERAL